MSGDVKVKLRLGAGMGKTYHTIPSASLSDEGRYFCKATNNMGEDEAYADIDLMGMLFMHNMQSF